MDARSEEALPKTVTSADGTRIAFEPIGAGPTLILIGGAFNDRTSPIAGVPMARLLSERFTAVAFDRRGRGQSSDAALYDPEREVEDVAALIAAHGGRAQIFGHSSGGVLALKAAAAGLPIDDVAVYEPPFDMAPDAAERSLSLEAELRKRIEAGELGDAAAYWMNQTGMPLEQVERMKQMPFWPKLAAAAPTLLYELSLLRSEDDAIGDSGKLANFAGRVLSMAGGSSGPRMQDPAQGIASVALHGDYRDVPGFGHMVPPEVIAPILMEFFGSR